MEAMTVARTKPDRSSMFACYLISMNTRRILDGQLGIQRDGTSLTKFSVVSLTSVFVTSDICRPLRGLFNYEPFSWG